MVGKLYQMVWWRFQLCDHHMCTHLAGDCYCAVQLQAVMTLAQPAVMTLAHTDTQNNSGLEYCFNVLKQANATNIVQRTTMRQHPCRSTTAAVPLHLPETAMHLPASTSAVLHQRVSSMGDPLNGCSEQYISSDSALGPCGDSVTKPSRVALRGSAGY